MKIELDWHVGYSETSDKDPNFFIPAQVPGAVQLDWAKYNNWPDYWYGENYKQYKWMEDVFWTYKTILTLPDVKQDEDIFFMCKGIDYQFKILIDGCMQTSTL